MKGSPSCMARPQDRTRLGNAEGEGAGRPAEIGELLGRAVAGGGAVRFDGPHSCRAVEDAHLPSLRHVFQYWLRHAPAVTIGAAAADPAQVDGAIAEPHG